MEHFPGLAASGVEAVGEVGPEIHAVAPAQLLPTDTLRGADQEVDRPLDDKDELLIVM